MTDDNRPIHRIRLSTISAAIFQNESTSGKTYYSTQFDRSYKDGDEWKHTRSFGREDLLLLGKLADMAHTWIHEQQASPNIDQPAEPGLS